MSYGFNLRMCKKKKCFNKAFGIHYNNMFGTEVNIIYYILMT